MLVWGESWFAELEREKQGLVTRETEFQVTLLSLVPLPHETWLCLFPEIPFHVFCKFREILMYFSNNSSLYPT